LAAWIEAGPQKKPLLFCSCKLANKAQYKNKRKHLFCSSGPQPENMQCRGTNILYADIFFGGGGEVKQTYVLALKCT